MLSLVEFKTNLKKEFKALISADFIIAIILGIFMGVFFSTLGALAYIRTHPYGIINCTKLPGDSESVPFPDGSGCYIQNNKAIVVGLPENSSVLYFELEK